jgi:DeoR/GlpR family transcriptional regulator of sugar metabolism
MESFKRLKRLEKIGEILKKRQTVSVDELAGHLRISPSSVRRDLKSLVQKKELDVIRFHGGISLSSGRGSPYDIRLEIESELKKSIAERVADQVEDGEFIMVCSGTTCFLTARALRTKKNLHIVTADIRIAEEMARYSNLEVFAVGGRIRTGYYTMVGERALEFLSHYNLKKLIFSADAIHPAKGISDETAFSVSIKKKAIEIADKVILVADYKKFGQVAMYKIEDIAAVDVIITNKELPGEFAETFRERGISLVLA